MEGEWNQHCRFSRTPNKRLHHTDHANKGSARCDAFSRVSRLLSLVDYEAVGMSTTCLPFFRFSYILRRFNVCLGASCLRSSRNREGAGGRHVPLLSWTTSLRRMEDTMTAVPVEPLTSAALVEGIGPHGQSHEVLFASLYKRFFRVVRAWSRALGGKSSDPDDIAQNVFVVVYRRLSDFDGNNVAGWLYRITLNQVRDHKRSAWERFRGYADAGLLDEVASPFMTPAKALEVRRELAAVSQTLAQFWTTPRPRSSRSKSRDIPARSSRLGTARA